MPTTATNSPLHVLAHALQDSYIRSWVNRTHPGTPEPVITSMLHLARETDLHIHDLLATSAATATAALHDLHTTATTAHQ